MKRAFKEIATTVLAVIFCLAPVALVAYAWKTTPVIYVSHSTGECVSWHDGSGAHACESAPKRAERVWVR